MLEVVLAVGLAAVSAGVLLGGLALVVIGQMAPYSALFRISPILGGGIIAASLGLTPRVLGQVMRRLCWKGLAAIWLPFLGYYGYEAHSLRRIGEDKTNDRDAH